MDFANEFGGEPLIGISVIESLSEQFLDLCKKYNPDHGAFVVTNGLC
jgi:hypothetical protein